MSNFKIVRFKDFCGYDSAYEKREIKLDKLNTDDVYIATDSRQQYEDLLKNSPDINIIYESSLAWNNHKQHLNWEQRATLKLFVFEKKSVEQNSNV